MQSLRPSRRFLRGIRRRSPPTRSATAANAFARRARHSVSGERRLVLHRRTLRPEAPAPSARSIRACVAPRVRREPLPVRHVSAPGRMVQSRSTEAAARDARVRAANRSRLHQPPPMQAHLLPPPGLPERGPDPEEPYPWRDAIAPASSDPRDPLPPSPPRNATARRRTFRSSNTPIPFDTECPPAQHGHRTLRHCVVLAPAAPERPRTHRAAAWCAPALRESLLAALQRSTGRDRDVPARWSDNSPPLGLRICPVQRGRRHANT